MADEWLIACYHEAENDIRWAKERSSKITYWSTVLSGAVIAASIKVPIPWWLLVIFTVAQTGAVILWLLDLHTFAQTARDWVKATAFPAGAVYPKAQKRDQHHTAQLVVQMGIVAVAM